MYVEISVISAWFREHARHVSPPLAENPGDATADNKTVRVHYTKRHRQL